jgi:hypothetical protein
MYSWWQAMRSRRPSCSASRRRIGAQGDNDAEGGRQPGRGGDEVVEQCPPLGASRAGRTSSNWSMTSSRRRRSSAATRGRPQPAHRGRQPVARRAAAVSGGASRPVGRQPGRQGVGGGLSRRMAQRLEPVGAARRPAVSRRAGQGRTGAHSDDCHCRTPHATARKSSDDSRPTAPSTVRDQKVLGVSLVND